MADDDHTGVIELAARRVPYPAALSEAAKAMLAMPRPAGGAYPALDDADGWRRLIAARNEASEQLSAPYAARLKADVAAHPLGGVPTYLATPQGERLLDE